MATVYKRDGSPYWQAKITVGGVVSRISTKKRTRAEAQRAADAREEQENSALVAAEYASIGLIQAASLFFAERDLRPKTIECYKSSLNNVYGILGDFPLNQLDVPGIRAYIAKRQEDPRAGTVAIRQDVAFLSSLITFAMGPDPRITKNPLLKWVDKKSLLPKAKERNTPFKPEDIDALLAACTEDYQRLFIMLCVDTGMRSGECRGLRWDEINLTLGEINLPASRVKTKDDRTVFLTPRCLDGLKHTFVTQKGRFEFVFQSRDGEGPAHTFKTFWAAACRRAKIGPRRIHDLRHTFASWAMDSGMDSLLVQRLLGHRSQSMTSRYAHPTKETLRREMKKFVPSTKSSTDSTKSKLLEARARLENVRNSGG